MFLRPKELAVTGAFMAIGVILLLLGGYFEGSTLFFLAAASFLAGILQRGISPSASITFLVGTVLLGFFLAPQKLYCVTFAVFGIYVIAAELLESNAARGKFPQKRLWVWIGKAVVFHGLLILSFCILQQLFGWEQLFKGKLFSGLQANTVLFFGVILLGAEVFWIVFDKAYFYVQNRYGGVFLRLLKE